MLAIRPRAARPRRPHRLIAIVGGLPHVRRAGQEAMDRTLDPILPAARSNARRIQALRDGPCTQVVFHYPRATSPARAWLPPRRSRPPSSRLPHSVAIGSVPRPTGSSVSCRRRPPGPPAQVCHLTPGAGLRGRRFAGSSAAAFEMWRLARRSCRGGFSRWSADSTACAKVDFVVRVCYGLSRGVPGRPAPALCSALMLSAGAPTRAAGYWRRRSPRSTPQS